jgi:hypothetical protein
MSCYNWERGTLKIPTRAWKPLRDALAAAYNSRQTRLYELAVRIHGLLVQQKKLAKRGAFKLNDAYEQLVHRSPNLWPRDLEGYQERDDVDQALFGKFGERGHGRTKLLLPKKKDFPLAVATKTTDYPADTGTITLDAAKHELRWYVEENNRAVESAHDSPMGRALFALLAKVEWTRGSGGTIVGNDEYNRDENRDHAGGGANYVTHRFAMKTQAEKDAEARERQRQRSYGGGYGRYR